MAAQTGPEPEPLPSPSAAEPAEPLSAIEVQETEVPLDEAVTEEELMADG